MTVVTKRVLQVGSLLVLIYALAALLGAVQGVSVRGPNFRASIGKQPKRGRCGSRRWKRDNANVASGMYGDAITSPGTDTLMVGPIFT